MNYMPNQLTTTLSGPYSIWFGRRVAMHLSAGEFQTTLNCTIVSESDMALRVRVADIWEIDIYKEMVLSIKAAQIGSAPFLADDPADQQN
jgi:hypothetical protein